MRLNLTGPLSQTVQGPAIGGWPVRELLDRFTTGKEITITVWDYPDDDNRFGAKLEKGPAPTEAKEAVELPSEEDTTTP